jgi:hypothetical protein
MVRMLSAVAIVIGLMIAPAAPAFASTSGSKCQQAQNALDTLSTSAANSHGVLQQAYLSMVLGGQNALGYYCH